LQGLRYEDITSMPMTEQTMTMQCIGNWIGGPLVGNARWGGTPFNNLLDMAGVRSEAVKVRFESADGYTTSIPLERALRDEVLLVWEMNGQELPSKHGFPMRLINPGHYGQKMPKWITRIELIDDPNHLGYWESLPKNKTVKWSDAAIATVNSRIDAPLSPWDDIKDPDNGGVTKWFQTIRGTADTKFKIHGIAMAGERQVERVEVSTNGVWGPWEEAHITAQSLLNQWVGWRYDWPLPASGRYEIVARATDSEGDRQPRTDVGNDLYDGRTGYHVVPVDVERTEA
jgi:DMSO/TMAO reductase YedYZ molybdopterin-dependent catalytic subunit